MGIGGSERFITFSFFLGGGGGREGGVRQIFQRGADTVEDTMW